MGLSCCTRSENIHSQNRTGVSVPERGFPLILTSSLLLIRRPTGSGMTIPNWDFTGSTFVTSNYIRLTPDEQSRQGSLWNNVPLLARNWEVHIEFKVSGRGKDLFGDGLAFWYVRKPLTLGPVFGNEELFVGLGVFLDTYANQNGAHSHGHPYISAMVNNGSGRYDHDRDGTHSELAGCEAKFRGVDHPTYLSVRYEGDVLTVSTDVAGKNEWAECFKVSGVQLPTGYYIGISAATGDLSDNHDIISLKTYALGATEAQMLEDRSNILPSAAHQAAHRPHSDDVPARSSVLKIFFIIIFSLIVLAVVIAVAYYFFQQRGVKRNRFY